MPKLMCLSVGAEGELESGYDIDGKNGFSNPNLASVIKAIFDKINMLADSCHADLTIVVTEWCVNRARYDIDPTRIYGRLG